MIWPEFLSEDGTILPEGGTVPRSGRANMWIMTPEMRGVHRDKLRVGISGVLVEGPKRVAEATVVRLIGAQP